LRPRVAVRLKRFGCYQRIFPPALMALP
jgi:hypothetical protein